MAKINIEAVVEEFGKVYIPGGQTAKDIKTKLFAQEETAAFFRKIPCEGDVYRSSYATIDEVLQAFSIPHMPKGELVFKPIEYRLGEFKIDALFVPDNFRASWLGFLATLEEADRSKWPILKWYMQYMLIPQSHEDFEKKVVHYGFQKTGEVDAAPVVDGATFERQVLKNTVTKANATMDGTSVIFMKLQAKNRVNVINTGVLSDDAETFCTQIENFVAQIDRDLRDKLDLLFMSKDRADLYREGRRLKYNLQYSQFNDMSAIKNSDMKVQGLTGMKGSNKIWATPAQNRVQPTHTDNTGKFNIQLFDRAIKLLTDWKKCLAFDVPEFIVVNDQESTMTLEMIAERY